MNEIQTNNFDYSVLDSSTAEYLKDRENSMSKTLEKTSEKLGEDLYKAQQKLSKNGYGQFEEWYSSLGFKKDKVYDFINRHKMILGISDNQNYLETFQELGSSLQAEMSKTSANPEINKKVFDGDITTHKEYKDEERKRKEAERRAEEAERKAKEQADQLEQAQRSQDILQSKLDEAENREPERVEVEKEVVPEDYEQTKKMLEDFKNKFNRESQSADNLREELRKYQEAFSDPSKAHEESQVKRLERESSINAYKLSIGIQKFIEDNAVESYKVSSVIKSNDAAKRRLEENIELLEDFTTNIKALLNGRIITN